MQGVQAHLEKSLLGENLGKIPEIPGKTRGNLGKSVKTFAKSLKI